MNLKSISKKLSLALRHRPEVFHLQLDDQGWCDVGKLIEGFRREGVQLSYLTLQKVVAENDKQRFAFSEDGQRIRANQGHSIQVDLNYEPATPPDILYHGTATKNIASIRLHGLQKRGRHHVHLSADGETAKKVGMRHGVPVILIVKAKEMFQEGILFFKSTNGVWLTDAVPVTYLEFPR